MVFIVETGAGTPFANAYATTTFVDNYLADRSRSFENAWISQAGARKQQAVVVATSYIDLRYGLRFKGQRARPLIPGRAATGTLSLSALPQLNETVTVGAIVYRFVDVLAQPNDVLRGALPQDSATNLASGIDSGGNGVSVHALTTPNYEAAAAATGTVVEISAQVEGSSGNDVAFASTVTGATVTGGGRLAYGLDESPQALQFPRVNLFSCEGAAIVGIPRALKSATAEYAVRSLVQVLAPDPTSDASGALVQSKREKVGPIEEETAYAQGAAPRIFRDYPEADRLLQEFLRSTGGVVR